MNTKLVFGITIIVVVIGAGAYFAIDQFSQKVSNSAVGADWKIYQNEKYGLEFRYPLEWTIDTNHSYADDAVGFNNGKIIVGTMGSPLVGPHGEDLTQEEYINFYFPDASHSSYQGTITKNWVRLGDNSVLRYQNDQQTIYVLFNNNLAYQFDIYAPYQSSDMTELEKVIATVSFASRK